MEESFNRIYERIEAQLDRKKDIDDAATISKKVYLVHEGPKKLPKRAQEVLDECLTGLIRECKVSLRYRNLKGRLKRYTISPYTLTAYKRGLYLVGHVAERGMIRVLSLERITKAEWRRGDTFSYPTDYSPERLFENAMFITIGEPENVELHFTPTTERFIEMRQFHPSQKLSKLESGRICMKLRVPVSFELVNWVLSFGEHIKVVAPERLREMVKEKLVSAISQYG